MEDRTVAIPSSGDDEADQEFLRRWLEHDAAIQNNLCPNGCGDLTVESESHKECPVCGFEYSVSSMF